jgi:hypothetical protein
MSAAAGNTRWHKQQLTTMQRCLCRKSPQKRRASVFGSLICLLLAASLGESCFM